MEITVKVECNELAAAIYALADALEGYPKHISAPKVTDEVGPAPEKPVKKAAKTDEKAPEPAEKPAEKQEKPIEFETVRAKMAQVMAAVGVEKAKNLVAELGFDGLSKVPAEQYPALLAKADEVLAK